MFQNSDDDTVQMAVEYEDPEGEMDVTVFGGSEHSTCYVQCLCFTILSPLAFS
jgi:hypothetical protein